MDTCIFHVQVLGPSVMSLFPLQANCKVNEEIEGNFGCINIIDAWTTVVWLLVQLLNWLTFFSRNKEIIFKSCFYFESKDVIKYICSEQVLLSMVEPCFRNSHMCSPFGVFLQNGFRGELQGIHCSIIVRLWNNFAY